MRQERKDSQNWQMGIYNMSAFSTALGRALAGKKAKVTYMEKSLHDQMKENQQVEDENLTEEQIVTERDNLLARLMTMQANFELNHSGED